MQKNLYWSLLRYWPLRDGYALNAIRISLRSFFFKYLLRKLLRTALVSESVKKKKKKRQWTWTPVYHSEPSLAPRGSGSVGFMSQCGTLFLASAPRISVSDSPLLLLGWADAICPGRATPLLALPLLSALIRLLGGLCLCVRVCGIPVCALLLAPVLRRHTPRAQPYPDFPALKGMESNLYPIPLARDCYRL